MEMKKRMKQRILVTIGICIILIAGFYFITNAITKYTGFSVSQEERLSDFENCLKEQKITLYINTNNAAETFRKMELVDYLHYFKIKNCLTDNSVCINEGINLFPSWDINGNKIERDISILELSKFSGCKLV